MRYMAARSGAGLALVVLALGPATPAAASCAHDAGPAGSPVIFLGTAEEERRGYTRFHVEEVWAGPDLAPYVWVLSGQEQPPWPLNMLLAVGSSVDADFAEGEEYVVGTSRSFSTSVCSMSEAGTIDPPADVRPPVDDGSTGADPPMGPLGQGLWVAAVVGVVAALVHRFRRRRASTPTRG